MNSIFNLVSKPAGQQLGLTLIHFLWEGSLIALVYALVRLNLRSAPARYRAACCALLLLAFTPLHCCDDAVVACLGTRLEYVRALLQLEELRTAFSDLRLASSASPLARRVQRLLG